MSNFYTKEINILKKKNIFRQRKCFEANIIDFASNDYLGFGDNEDLLDNAFLELKKHKSHSPKASMLVNGYSLTHKEFEDNLKFANDFEDCIVVGSGFLANIALIESLVRAKDILFIDKEFHASGVLSSKLVAQKDTFLHNNYLHLEELIKKYITSQQSGRIIIAIEGVYSMSGDICRQEFFELAIKYNALLIIDEAHSSGVIGDKCLGVMDYYNISPAKNYIKMGTLGKAYGSYGAYILASHEIISYLENRAKSIIYSTAISLFDISLANEGFKKIQNEYKQIKIQISNAQKIIKNSLGVDKKALIFPLIIGDDKKVVKIQNELLKNNILIGAIRQPTVNKALLRIIAQINKPKSLKKLCNLLKDYTND